MTETGKCEAEGCERYGQLVMCGGCRDLVCADHAVRIETDTGLGDLVYCGHCDEQAADDV